MAVVIKLPPDPPITTVFSWDCRMVGAMEEGGCSPGEKKNRQYGDKKFQDMQNVRRYIIGEGSSPGVTESARPQKSASSLLRMIPVLGEKTVDPNLKI